MSQDYRVYPDNWRLNLSVKDEPADVSTSFQITQQVISEISDLLKSHAVSPEQMEIVMLEEMAKAVFGSNNLSRLGLCLDETLKICRIFLPARMSLSIPSGKSKVLLKIKPC
jgi:hypothetical protein